MSTSNTNSAHVLISHEDARFWEAYYKDFGLDDDFSDLMVPALPQEGCWKLIVISQRFSSNPQLVFNALKGVGYPVYKVVEDLGISGYYKFHHARIGEHGIYVPWSQEGHLVGIGDVLKRDGKVMGTSLSEQMIFDHFFHQVTGECLGGGKQVLCVGSKNGANDGIPVLYRVPDRASIFVLGSEHPGPFQYFPVIV